MGTLTKLRGTQMQSATGAHAASSQSSATKKTKRGLISGTGWVSSFAIIITGGTERPAATARISQSSGPPRFMDDSSLGRSRLLLAVQDRGIEIANAGRAAQARL